MSTASVYADSGDGCINGENASNDYSLARSEIGDGGSIQLAATSATCGQKDDGFGTIDVYRLFFPFTLALGAGASISAAELRFTCAVAPTIGTTGVKVNRTSALTIPLSGAEEANYDAGLAGTLEGTLVANWRTSWANDTDKTLAVDPASVNANGTTYYCVISGDDVSNTAPGGGNDETGTIYMSEHATAGKRPQLTVTYTIAAGGANTGMLALLGVGG